MLRKSSIPVLTALVVLTIPSIATAGEGEHVLSIRPEYVYSDGHGGGLSVGYQYGFNDFVNLWVDVGWSYESEVMVDDMAMSAQRLFSTVGAVYHLDSFQWVPYLSTSVGVYSQLLDVGGTRTALGFQLGGGVDYRPSREWSVGVYGMFHAMAYGEVSHHASAGLRLGLYFR